MQGYATEGISILRWYRFVYKQLKFLVRTEVACFFRENCYWSFLNDCLPFYLSFQDIQTFVNFEKIVSPIDQNINKLS